MVNSSFNSPVDDIRGTSGRLLPRHDLPISINQECLSHQQSGKDTALTLKLFKIACLAYKPSDIVYRDMPVDRTTLIEIRRGLIDKATNILPRCDLFQANAIYPRRYFDDLMVEAGIEKKKQLEKLHFDVSKHHLIRGSPSNHELQLNTQSSKVLTQQSTAHPQPFGFGKLNSHLLDNKNRHSGKGNLSLTIDVDQSVGDHSISNEFPSVQLNTASRRKQPTTIFQSDANLLHEPTSPSAAKHHKLAKYARRNKYHDVRASQADQRLE
jgi:hypothetical protein